MPTDYRKQTLEELSTKSGELSARHGLVGLDGFVDVIVQAVQERHGQGEAFTPFPNIASFGERIVSAAGKSLNIELHPRLEKIGGNGPIMANALLSFGLPLRYLGALGEPAVHPVFDEFARKTEAKSLCDPGITHAVEFEDGKLMLGKMASLDEITYERLVEVVGEGLLLDLFNRADLIALVNWTMIPNLTSVFNALVDRVFPNLGPNENRLFFFDLCDPQKRSQSDLRAALQSIARFTTFGRVTLGLNLREAQQVYKVLDHAPVGEEPADLEKMAREIHEDLHLTTVVIHPVDGAACATRDDTWYVQGPYCEKPKITTGAGDHFNAGFSLGQLLGLTPPACLTLGVSTSGFYVRHAQSPRLYDLDTFLRAD